MGRSRKSVCEKAGLKPPGKCMRSYEMVLSNTPVNMFLPDNRVPYCLLILRRASKELHGSLGCIPDLSAFFTENARV